MNYDQFGQANGQRQMVKSLINPYFVNQLPNSWPTIEKSSGSIRHKFTKAEDELLKSLVEKYGETNWVSISAQMKTRSPRQCRERYKNYLSPKIKNGPWTPEEEELLVQKVKELGQRWANIALYFEPRSDVNVKNHWTSMINRQARERNAQMKKSIANMLQDNAMGIQQQGAMMQNQHAMLLPPNPYQAQMPSFYNIGYMPNMFPNMNMMVQQQQQLQQQKKKMIMQQTNMAAMNQMQQLSFLQQSKQLPYSTSNLPQQQQSRALNPPPPPPAHALQQSINEDMNKKTCPIFNMFEKQHQQQQQSTEWFDQDLPDWFDEKDDDYQKDGDFVWE